MAPGGRWSGEYNILDLDDFRGISLDVNTPHTEFGFKYHIVKRVVKHPSTMWQFPVKTKYDKANLNLEARDDPAKAAREDLVQPPEVDAPELDGTEGASYLSKAIGHKN